MIQVDPTLSPRALLPALERLFGLSGQKLEALRRRGGFADGAPVYTVAGRYTSRGWTEWTQGFLYGSGLLQFDATGDSAALAFGSTYGNLHRLIREGKVFGGGGELQFCELALKLSGAVQAARWTDLPEGLGYIYSFNGPHSLFSDTLRSLRVLALGHQLGHVLMGERDRKISLFDRLLRHAETTARYNVYFGAGRDIYDLRGRVAHESIFNLNDGSYRCPSTQQGYSPFSTWTRGLAWILCGYAELLEFFATLPEAEFASHGGKDKVVGRFREVATAVADYYLEHTPALARLGDYLGRPADPFNDHEPVDSSAAAIAAQGLIRLGNALEMAGTATPYLQAGLTVARSLFREPYLSLDPGHEGLILHAVYHRPNGWDHIPAGRKVPCGESCLWGDYHARELALLLLGMARGDPYYTFFIGETEP